uniref:Uncharacterized protein n=1 Tax=Meloidogyne incognita TaxID=6306 RepID=A0A914LAG5_MELIC
MSVWRRSKLTTKRRELWALRLGFIWTAKAFVASRNSTTVSRRPTAAVFSEMDDQVFIINFGLARQRQEKSRPTGACPILGTDAYRPISNCSRVEYQPKDDIESWFYMCH